MKNNFNEKEFMKGENDIISTVNYRDGRTKSIKYEYNVLKNLIEFSLHDEDLFKYEGFFELISSYEEKITKLYDELYSDIYLDVDYDEKEKELDLLINEVSELIYEKKLNSAIDTLKKHVLEANEIIKNNSKNSEILDKFDYVLDGYFKLLEDIKSRKGYSSNKKTFEVCEYTIDKLEEGILTIKAYYDKSKVNTLYLFKAVCGYSFIYNDFNSDNKYSNRMKGFKYDCLNRDFKVFDRELLIDVEKFKAYASDYLRQYFKHCLKSIKEEMEKARKILGSDSSKYSELINGYNDLVIKYSLEKYTKEDYYNFLEDSISLYEMIRNSYKLEPKQLRK